MESNSEASCVSDPNFAVICAFLERFASSCGITYPPFMDLQEMLENIKEVPQELVDLHITLLRKARKSVIREKWEKALIKFCHTYSMQDGWEIERFGYKNSRLEVKLRALKCLLEGQFDLNNKFKTGINAQESAELRSKPIGKDESGRIYWLQIDPISHIRVYREDLDEESWTLVAKDRESLVHLLQELSGEVESLDINLLNGNSTFSENVDVEKDITDTGQDEIHTSSDNIVNNCVIPQTDLGKDSLLESNESGAVNVQVKNDGDFQEKDAGGTEKKRFNSDEEEERENLKKLKLSEGTGDEPEVGDAIEEPVVHVYGEGNGAECEAGNPEKEESKTEEGEARSNLGDQSEPITSSQSNAEVKPQPKLWTIDTICGTGSFNHSGETSSLASKTVLKSNQKNFSSFSIESVLEKKPADAESCRDQTGNSHTVTINSIRNEMPAPVSNALDDTERGDNVLNSKDVDKDDGTSPPVSLSDSAAYSNTQINSVPKEKSDESVELNPCPETRFEDSQTVVKDVEDVVKDIEDDVLQSKEEANSEEQAQKAGIKLDDPVQSAADEVLPTSEGANEKQSRVCENVNLKVSVDNDNKQALATGEIRSDILHSETDDDKLLSPVSSIQKEMKIGKEFSHSGNAQESLRIAESEIVHPEREVSEARGEMVNAEDFTFQKYESRDVITRESDTKAENPKVEDTEIASESVTPTAESEVHQIEKEHEGTDKIDKEKEAGSNEETVVTEELRPYGERVVSENELVRNKEKEEPSELKVELEEKEVKEESNVSEKSKEEQSTVSVQLKKEQDSSNEIRNEEEPSESQQIIKEEEKKVAEVKEEEALSEEVKKEKREEPVASEEAKEDKEHDRTEVFSIVDKSNESEKSEISVPVTTDNAYTSLPHIAPYAKKVPQSPGIVSTEIEKEAPVEDNVAATVKEEDRHETQVEEPAEEIDTLVNSDVQKNMKPYNLESEEEKAVSVQSNEQTDMTRKNTAKEPVGTIEEESKIEEMGAGHAAEVEAADQFLTEESDKSKITAPLKGENPAEAEVSPLAEAPAQKQPEAEEDPDGAEKEEEVARPRRRRRGKRRVFTQKTSVRSRPESAVVGDDTPQTLISILRATRSRTSTEEKEETEKQVRGKRGGKRKSQDAAGLNDMNEDKATPEDVEEAPLGDGVAGKKPQKRRGSAVNSMSDENSTAVQEDSSEGVGGKRMRVRGRKSLDSRIRKSVEEKRNQERNDEASTDEDGKVEEEGQAATATKEEEDDGDGNKKKRTQKAKPKDGTPRQRQLIPEREIKLLGLSNMEELPTVRQSRRIAQMKLKEEAERNRLKKLQEAKEEEERLKKKKAKTNKGAKGAGPTKKKKKAESEEYEEEEEEASDEKDVKDKKRRRKKKDKLRFNELNPWISSSASSTADEEEEELEDEEEEVLFKSDHEFSPESEVEDSDYKPVKRARTAKVDPKEATGETTKYDDTACEKCRKKDHPEWILLCDKCDKGWHASCVRPALMVVPEGDWFCPPCEHASLIEKLRESLVVYDRCKKQRENEELRRKRLAFVGISLANVIPSKKDKKPKETEGHERERDSDESGLSSSEGSSSGSSSSDSDTSSSDESDEPVYQLRQRRSNVRSYRYNEYDELIKSALQEEMEAVKSVGEGKARTSREQTERDEDESEEENEASADKVGGENAPPEEDTRAGVVGKGVAPAKKAKAKKRNKGDDNYEAETDAEEEEKEDDDAEEELPDRVPPVVPVYDKKKKRKSRSLNVKGLDFTSDEEEEDNSDSDFKGGSSDEESDFSLPSGSESSEGVGKRKGYGAPVRRSTRARTARYDKDFINDDSDEEETPRRKKSRNVWVSSESSDSDRSWGRRKKKNNRGGNRSTVPKKSTPKSKKKKNKKRIVDSENEDGVTPSPKKPRNPKICYGGINPDVEILTTRRTRGKKINYREMNASDSEDEIVKRKPRAIGESDEEFVAEKEKSEESEEEAEEEDVKNEKVTIRKESILRRLKKRRKRMAERDEPSDDDDDEWLEEFADELEELDTGEEDLLEEMLCDDDVPVSHLRTALERLRERREEKSPTAESDYSKPYPPIPDHMENPGLTPKFPKIEKMSPAPQIAAPVTLPPLEAKSDPLLIGNGRDGDAASDPTANPSTESRGRVVLIDDTKSGVKEMMPNVRPPPYPFPLEDNKAPLPPYNTFHRVIDAHARLPPEYPHANVPTTVLGLERDSPTNLGVRKPGAKCKRDGDESSPLSESCEENSGDGRLSVPDGSVDSPPKRRGRGRGKKQLLAEAQAKKELAMATVQAPTQFPARGVAPESGSVITRILNAPQGPQPFVGFPLAGRARPPFRTTPFPNAPRPAAPPPSPSRVRTPSLFSSLDSPASNLSQPKSSPHPAGLPRGAASVLPGRYPSDPGIRPPPFPPTRSSPNRNESYPYTNFYAYPPGVPNGEDTPPPFHAFSNHSFEEQQQPLPQSAGVPPGATHAPAQSGEEEASGEFGGLASYFASQREDDLDT